MPRSGPSAADQELIAHLAGRDLAVSPAQLERWRRAGLLPRNTRHGRSRGQGSASAVPPAAVEIAAVLAGHARQGRDLRLAVVDWFAQAGRVVPGDTAVPEPPDAAVCAAVEWMTASSPVTRLIQQARAALTDPQIDAFYEAAGQAMNRAPVPPALDPAAIREALLTGQDADDPALPPGLARAALVQVIAAVGLGFEEVPADLLAEALADSGIYPAAEAGALEQTLARFQHPPAAAQPLADLLFLRYDPLDMARMANADLLRRARDVAHGLGGAGALYLLHALLMPDTPGLAALRALIDELGIGQALMSMGASLHTTRGFASTLVACLHPFYWTINDYLTSQMTDGPPLLHGPGDEHNAEQFMADWTAALRSITPSASHP